MILFETTDALEDKKLVTNRQTGDRATSLTFSKLLGRGAHNDARGARGTARDGRAESTRGVETRARKRKREDRDAQAGVAFPGLPFDVAVSIVEEHVPDPADLAVLRGVSRGMRDAVDATGLKLEEMLEEDAAERGCLSTLKCLRRRGRLRDGLGFRV